MPLQIEFFVEISLAKFANVHSGFGVFEDHMAF